MSDMIRINYESDFKIEERRDDGGLLQCVPFAFTYCVGIDKGVHVATYDGKVYKGCSPTDDGKGIVVAIDARLGTGRLKAYREWMVRDKRHDDGVCNVRSIDTLEVELGRGVTDTAVVKNYVHLPFTEDDIPASVAEVRDGVLAITADVSGGTASAIGSVMNNILYL